MEGGSEFRRIGDLVVSKFLAVRVDSLDMADVFVCLVALQDQLVDVSLELRAAGGIVFDALRGDGRVVAARSVPSAVRLPHVGEGFFVPVFVGVGRWGGDLVCVRCRG